MLPKLSCMVFVAFPNPPPPCTSKVPHASPPVSPCEGSLGARTPPKAPQIVKSVSFTTTMKEERGARMEEG